MAATDLRSLQYSLGLTGIIRGRLLPPDSTFISELMNGAFMTSFLQIFSINYTSPTKKTISSRTIIGLEVDPPAPFKYFGKSILETTGRLALSIALSEIGNAFVQVPFLIVPSNFEIER
jgi:hypothetical protein